MEHAQNLRMNLSGMDGVQYKLFKSEIDISFHEDSDGRGSGPAFLNPGMGHTATKHRISLAACFLENQQIFFKLVQTLKSQQLGNFTKPRIKSKNILIVEQISLSLYTMELQSGVFPPSCWNLFLH